MKRPASSSVQRDLECLLSIQTDVSSLTVGQAGTSEFKCRATAANAGDLLLSNKRDHWS